MTPGIAVYSKATVCTLADVKAAVAACDKQMQAFCADWSRPPIVVQFYVSEKDIPAGMPTVLVADECDDPQALAYHTEGTDGRITGLVGAKTCIDAGETWSSALSHELLEAAIDPFVDFWCVTSSGRNLVAVEVCDPVQDQTYKIDGIDVSNYVKPAWFDDSAAPGSSFDALGSLSAPFTKTRGGYYVQMVAGHTSQVGLRALHRATRGRGMLRSAQ